MCVSWFGFFLCEQVDLRALEKLQDKNKELQSDVKALETINVELRARLKAAETMAQVMRMKRHTSNGEDR